MKKRLLASLLLSCFLLASALAAGNALEMEWMSADGASISFSVGSKGRVKAPNIDGATSVENVKWTIDEETCVKILSQTESACEFEAIGAGMAILSFECDYTSEEYDAASQPAPPQKKHYQDTTQIRVTAPLRTVTLDPNGGTVSENTKRVTDNFIYGDLPTPERAGYTFDGWYTAPGGGKRINEYVDTVTGDITLYAHWSASNLVLAVLYEDGSMVFQHERDAESEEDSVVQWFVVDLSGYKKAEQVPWHAERDAIKSVSFSEEVRPLSTSYWFYRCKNLTEIENMDNLDTSKVTDMSCMFSYCSALAALDVSGFDTSAVTDMSVMFKDCSALTELNVGGFNTSQVTDMMMMFQGCSELTALDLSGFNVSLVTNARGMFAGCGKLKTIYASSGFAFKGKDEYAFSGLFQGATALTGGKGFKYDAKKVSAEYARLDNPPDSPGYFTEKAPDASGALTLTLESVTVNGADITVKLNGDAPDGSFLYVAAYATGGKFVTFASQAAVTGDNKVTLPAEGVTTVTAFLFDGDMKPLCDKLEKAVNA